MSQKVVGQGKKPYEKPEMQTYSSAKLLSEIGPARAIYPTGDGSGVEGFPP